MRAHDWECPHCHLLFETPTTRVEHEATCRKDPSHARAFDRRFLQKLRITPDEETHYPRVIPLPSREALLSADLQTVDAMVLAADQVREALFDASRESSIAPLSVALERLRMLERLATAYRGLLADRLKDEHAVVCEVRHT
jgi:hypothetical protein